MALNDPASSPSSSRVRTGTTWSRSPPAIARAPRVADRMGSRIERLRPSAIAVATTAEPIRAMIIHWVDSLAAARARSLSSSMFFWFRSSTASASFLISLNVGKSRVK